MKHDVDPFSCFLEHKNDSQEYRSQANWARGVLAHLRSSLRSLRLKTLNAKGAKLPQRAQCIAQLHFYDYPRARFDPSIIRFLWIWD